MSKQDDGGPAFPVGQELNPNGEVMTWATYGMSLRDWFAAKATDADLDVEFSADSTRAQVLKFLGLPEDTPWSFDLWRDARAKARYLHADAMLRARAVDGGGR